MSFSTFGLHADIVRGVKELGFTRPTQVQTDAIPPALEGKDLLACAMTGSGKTAAFLLPIVHRLMEKKRGVTRALILTPTRELAAQIAEDLQELSVHTPVTGAAVFGGVGMAPQEHAFRSGVDVLIATPGRLLDHFRHPYAKLDHLEVLVLDEADRMLDMGFLPDIKRVLRHIPSKRQTLFFSATMPPPIAVLSQEMLVKPVKINVERQAAPAVGITQAVYPVAQTVKTPLLLALLARGDIESVLVFTRTKHRANRLAEQLVKKGVAAERIHGNRSQAQRIKALEGFKDGTYKVLVATDIAARGIDVSELGHVINFDVPAMPEDYIHRVGRTARAQATGDAYTFVAPEEEEDLRAIERAIGRRLPRVTLPDFDYAQRAEERLEVPLAERIAAIKARKAEDRARAAAKAKARETRGAAGGQSGAPAAKSASGGARPGQGARGGAGGRDNSPYAGGGAGAGASGGGAGRRARPNCNMMGRRMERARRGGLAALVACMAFAGPVAAQHGHEPARTDSMPMRMDSMPMHGDSMAPMHKHPMGHDMAGHNMSQHDMTQHDMSAMWAPLGIPMTRHGSGTAWVPDASPMYGEMIMTKHWMVMLHGAAFLQYTSQGGERGDDQLGSVNWGMAMAQRRVGGAGRLTLRGMLSAEPLTVGGRGYPLLLQSGESYHGELLHDRQHPHDLFMELAAQYEHEVTRNVGVMLYAAPAGEPASGPVAFMHRPSAINDPFAPIAHHWQDATHISFGVVTAGVFTRHVQVEGSVFNGREPDDNRYDFDFRRLDSYAGRVTVNPAARWSVSGSFAYLASPEASEPDEAQHRATGSVLYGRPVGGGDVSAALVYGGNRREGSDHFSHTGLAEANWTIDTRNALFGRVELAQKDAHELVLGAGAPSGVEFNVGAASLGYVRELVVRGGGALGVGVSGTVNRVPASLETTYGTRTPLGGAVFLRVRSGRMRH